MPGDSPRFSPARAAMQQFPWRVARLLSSGVERVETFLFHAGFARAPWLAVAFASGIAAWFALANVWQWLALLGALLAVALGSQVMLREEGRFPFLRAGIGSFALVMAAGSGTVWVKSEMVGAPAISGPWVGVLAGRVVSREEDPARDRVRLVIATRNPESQRAIKVRINVPLERDALQAQEGAIVRVRARLVPPAPPMLPGSYDFARAAWFDGLVATGSALDAIEVARPGNEADNSLARVQRSLSDHVRARIAGSAGGIAAAFASGDRGAISQTDEDAMRDAGLTHLLSVSGLHVSAVIAIAYFLSVRLLGLWPWLVLRVPVPLVAAASGAAAAVGYTLLTGAQVPTVRSCIGALLVLAALVIGREPLSMRLIAVAAFLVMLVWPEAVVGPSFQMSFASVIAIVALHESAPMKAFLAQREEAWWERGLRRIAMLLLTGVVIDVALMPIALYHFHRAGIYGALANVLAIPLTEMVVMPMLGLALLLDVAGLGGPVWWIVERALNALLGLAHFVAGLPGAVNHMPAMGEGGFLLFVAGSLWLALWQGWARLLGFAPVAVGTVMLAFLHPPDLLIAGDGRHVGIIGLVGDGLVIVREARSDFSRESLSEMAGMDGPVVLLRDYPGVRCSAAFCALEIERGGRPWHLLFAMGGQPVAVRDLAAACELSDIVVADRHLPGSCRPRVLKADRWMLDKTGGLTLDLANMRIASVAEDEGQHGWWHPVQRTFNPTAPPPAPEPSASQ